MSKKLYNTFQRTKENIHLLNDRKYLKDYKILFIPGYFIGIIPKIMKSLRIPKIYIESFKDQKKYFQSLNIETEILKTHPLQTTQYNREIIAKYLQSSTKKIIAITHSKGSLELLDTLILYKKLHKKIKGWIAIQSPFKGTPLMDLAQDNSLSKGILGIIAKYFGGNKKTGASLTIPKRTAYLKKYQKQIKNIFKNIPTITLGTFLKPTYIPSPIDIYKKRISILNPIIILLEQHKNGDKNDGLVPLYSTYISPNTHMYLPNMDHAATNTDIPLFRSYGKKQRIILTRILIHTLLDTLSQIKLKSNKSRRKNEQNTKTRRTNVP